MRTNHKNDQCSVKNKEKFSCCLNYNEIHSAWIESCKNLQKIKKYAIHTYNNQFICFITSIRFNTKNDFNSSWITIFVTDKKKIASINITKKNSDKLQTLTDFSKTRTFWSNSEKKQTVEVFKKCFTLSRKLMSWICFNNDMNIAIQCLKKQQNHDSASDKLKNCENWHHNNSKTVLL